MTYEPYDLDDLDAKHAAADTESYDETHIRLAAVHNAYPALSADLRKCVAALRKIDRSDGGCYPARPIASDTLDSLNMRRDEAPEPAMDKDVPVIMNDKLVGTMKVDQEAFQKLMHVPKPFQSVEFTKAPEPATFRVGQMAVLDDRVVEITHLLANDYARYKWTNEGIQGEAFTREFRLLRDGEVYLLSDGRLIDVGRIDVEMPERAGWVAMDSRGQIYGYMKRPFDDDITKTWAGSHCAALNAKPYLPLSEWRSSLARVHRVEGVE